MEEALDYNYVLLRDADAVTRSEFIKNTYKHLAGAVLAFVLVEAILLKMPFAVGLAQTMVSSQMTWLLVLGGFMFVTSYAEKMAVRSHDRNKQYLGLGIYVLAQAIIFLPLIMMAIAMGGGTALIQQAALITLALFVGLSLVVFTTGKDFSFLKTALTVGGFVAIGLIIAGAIFGFNLGLAFSGGMVVLAAGSILYQTSNMVHKYSTDQHVAAALGLFASVMLLFWYILQLLMSRD
ncbi:MAG: Bax inhibitor-1 family protein [Flavobacteriales bacterium]